MCWSLSLCVYVYIYINTLRYTVISFEKKELLVLFPSFEVNEMQGSHFYGITQLLFWSDIC